MRKRCVNGLILSKSLNHHEKAHFCPFLHVSSIFSNIEFKRLQYLVRFDCLHRLYLVWLSTIHRVFFSIHRFYWNSVRNHWWNENAYVCLTSETRLIASTKLRVIYHVHLKNSLLIFVAVVVVVVISKIDGAYTQILNDFLWHSWHFSFQWKHCHQTNAFDWIEYI